MRTRCFRADLHIHTCLSPCAEAEMTPGAIIRVARQAELDLIAVCDHNSAENVPAVVEAAKEEGLEVLGGLEVASQEEVHVLGLFDVRDNADALDAMQNIVYRSLSGVNDEEAFGEQLVCGGDGSVAGRSDRLLIGATTLPIQEVVEAIRGLGGLVIASHVDRESFSITGQLGFVPEGLRLDAMEISPRAGETGEWRTQSQKRGIPLIASSDAHRLGEIGAASTVFRMAEASVDGLRKALGSAGGARVLGR